MISSTKYFKTKGKLGVPKLNRLNLQINLKVEK